MTNIYVFAVRCSPERATTLSRHLVRGPSRFPAEVPGRSADRGRETGRDVSGVFDDLYVLANVRDRPIC